MAGHFTFSGRTAAGKYSCWTDTVCLGPVFFLKIAGQLTEGSAKTPVHTFVDRNETCYFLLAGVQRLYMKRDCGFAVPFRKRAAVEHLQRQLHIKRRFYHISLFVCKRVG